LPKTWPIGIATKIGHTHTIAGMLQRIMVQAGKKVTVKSMFYNHRRNLKEVWCIV